MYIRKSIIEKSKNISEEEKKAIDQKMAAQKLAAREWVKKETQKAANQLKAYEERRKR